MEFNSGVTYASLTRQAAEALASLNLPPLPDHTIHTPVFSGFLKVEQVQPGLLATACNLTSMKGDTIEFRLDRSIVCGLLLSGEGETMEIGGYGPSRLSHNRPNLVAMGQGATCRSIWSAGQRSSVGGFVLQPAFFDRFDGLVTTDGLAALERLLEGEVQEITLPRTRKITSIARRNLDNPYAGPLGRIFLESNVLRYLVEISTLLEEKRFLEARIGRVKYDRLMEARGVLDASLVNPPKTLDLARQVGINVTTLQANFKLAFGTTIFGYVRDRRLATARILMADHGLSIAEVGYRVGYASPAAFTAAYRRHFGHPPSAEKRQKERKGMQRQR